MTDQITLTVERQPEGLTYRRKMVLPSPSISSVLGWLTLSLGIPLLALFFLFSSQSGLMIVTEQGARMIPSAFLSVGLVSFTVGFFVASSVIALAILTLAARFNRAGRAMEALRGPQTIVFAHDGIEITDQSGCQSWKWRAISRVQRQTLTSRSLIMRTPAKRAFFLVANHTEPLLIPDETLPEGLTPKAFQTQLERWSTA